MLMSRVNHYVTPKIYRLTKTTFLVQTLRWRLNFHQPHLKPKWSNRPDCYFTLSHLDLSDLTWYSVHLYSSKWSIKWIKKLRFIDNDMISDHRVVQLLIYFISLHHHGRTENSWTHLRHPPNTSFLTIPFTFLPKAKKWLMEKIRFSVVEPK